MPQIQPAETGVVVFCLLSLCCFVAALAVCIWTCKGMTLRLTRHTEFNQEFVATFGQACPYCCPQRRPVRIL